MHLGDRLRYLSRMLAYKFVTWRPMLGERPRGLFLDTTQAKLLNDLKRTKRELLWERQRGLFLDTTQEKLLDDLKKKKHELDQAVTSLLEHGLTFEGHCPRCGHWMSWAIPFGVMVDEAALQKMIKKHELASASGVGKRVGIASRGSDPENPTLTFVCACGSEHVGRPDAAAFTGCGAAWNQPMTGNSEWPPDSSSTFELSSATPAEAEWATHIKQDLSAPPLARIRGTANQWRNGVTALTTVLTAVAILTGTIDSSKLHTPAKWLALGLSVSGFASLLVGTLVILSASLGVSGYDHRLLAPHALRRYERRRGRKAIRQIQWTQRLVMLGILLIAGAGFVAFANPNW